MEPVASDVAPHTETPTVRTEITPYRPAAGAQLEVLPVAHIKQNQQAIFDLMRDALQYGIDFGEIPGTDKKTMLKPGAEKVLMMFGLSVEVSIAQDLGDHDSIRYRIILIARSRGSGVVIGSGVGECSSNEEKYRWRRVVCVEEFEDAPPDRKREAWKMDRQTKKPYQVKQIRTVPADVANTILKMAKKRALVDLALTCTAASSLFTQDYEDLPEYMKDEKEQRAAPPTPAPAGRKPTTSTTTPPPPPVKGPGVATGTGSTTEKQYNYLCMVVNDAIKADHLDEERVKLIVAHIGRNNNWPEKCECKSRPAGALYHVSAKHFTVAQADYAIKLLGAVANAQAEVVNDGKVIWNVADIPAWAQPFDYMFAKDAPPAEPVADDDTPF